MKSFQTIVACVVSALLASSLSSLSWDGDDANPAAFFRMDIQHGGSGPPTPGLRVFRSASAGSAASMIASETASRVGSGWVGEALKLARIESGYRCDAVNHHSGATGLGQLMFASAEILEPGSGAHRADCAVGARLLAKHMARCLQAGATTDKLMERCHLAGWNSLGRRLKKKAERYVRSYQRMVEGAKPLQVADASGWITRGTTSILGD